ncbi:hypothetical protein F0562_009126 [Nyssa sinensis]|uniref:Uncharacterized protein n=1 Tax=Nyssa sinensis TaxID=561372 RepID=A0A5J4ZZ75_9ASTE|nr:hypothetical protein F0562_009126 [Nyssa sinensis]
MARVLSQALFRSLSSSSSTTPTFHFSKSPPLGLSHRILSHRNRSNQSGEAQLIEVDLKSDGDEEALGIRKLEEAIHSIIVKRSAPDWLPFIPGSSYWVPPRSFRPYNGVVELVGKLANPLTEDEAMSFTSSRGWHSSAYIVEGCGASAYPVPMEVEVEVKIQKTSENASQSDDEEG